jgi:hypothetical protein
LTILTDEDIEVGCGSGRDESKNCRLGEVHREGSGSCRLIGRKDV